MTARELRKKYVEFFESKGHKEIPSASLIPENDPTTLFISAGMHPLVPYLMGEKHPAGNRLVDVQKLVRTGDIDEVGDAVHLTFFEMLGNWSLGDYFKKEAIEWSFEFLTGKKWLNIPKEKLAITVFQGDPPPPKGFGEAGGEVPPDDEAEKIWLDLGISKERIARLGREDNWWGPAGETGPCGPDSEMFYWTGASDAPKEFDPQDKKWVEIWNDVFMQYNKTKDGRFEPLKQKNIDTGMGLERTLAVLNGNASVYETELFEPIIKEIGELSGKKYKDNEKAFRIIADHLRAATFILGDEKAVVPSNKDRGYVLRRLIRRSIRHGYGLGIREIFTFKVAKTVIKSFANVYLELKENKDFIINQLIEEEKKFKKTLEKGLKEFEKMKPEKIASFFSKSFATGYGLSGDDLFNLYSTYGFPIEMSLEEIKKLYQEYNREQGVNITALSKVDEDRILQQFHESLKKHQELSRTASAGMFKGGLADASDETKKLHTAAHLMLASLRKVLGDKVFQKGSNITPERLRFDFSYEGKMTPEQIKQVEDLVNEQIKLDFPVKMEEMSLEEAKKQGAMGVFEAKYGKKVKVYTIGNFSKEICGGPHAGRAGELRHFKIVKEESVSAGARRIKAVLE